MTELEADETAIPISQVQIRVRGYSIVEGQDAEPTTRVVTQFAAPPGYAEHVHVGDTISVPITLIALSGMSSMFTPDAALRVRGCGQVDCCVEEIRVGDLPSVLLVTVGLPKGHHPHWALSDTPPPGCDKGQWSAERDLKRLMDDEWERFLGRFLGKREGSECK